MYMLMDVEIIQVAIAHIKIIRPLMGSIQVNISHVSIYIEEKKNKFKSFINKVMLLHSGEVKYVITLLKILRLQKK